MIVLNSRLLLDLRAAFRRGEVDRGEFLARFWSVTDHLELVRAALATSDVKSLEITAEEMIVTVTSGVKLVWSPQDRGGPAARVICNGDYEPEETELLLAFAERGSVFIDVGANVGWYALNMARQWGGQGLKIYAFEPITSNYTQLRRNIEINDLADVIKVFPVALGEADGGARFFIPEDMPGGASIVELHPSMASRQEVCPVATLDAVLADEGVGRVDILKCDVEGAEFNVLKGAKGVLARDRPVLLLELLRKYSKAFGYHPNDVFRYLAAMGYEAFAIGKGVPRAIAAVDDETIETNFIFLSPAHQRERDSLRRFGLEAT